MNKKRKKTISEIFEEGTSIDEALKKGVQDAMLLHKKLGKPVVVWQDGKIIWLKPEEIIVDNNR